MRKTLLSSSLIAADYKAARLMAQSAVSALLPLTLGTIAPAQIVTFNASILTAAQSTSATFNATQTASGLNATPSLSRTGLTAASGTTGTGQHRTAPDGLPTSAGLGVKSCTKVIRLLGS